MIYVVAAVPQEVARVCRRPGVELVLTGVGFARARAAARSLAERLAPGDRVLSTGFCGALAPDLKPGQVVVYERVAVEGADPVVLEAEDAPPASDGGETRRVRGLTVPTIVNGAQARARLRRERTADVVDMESGILAEACRPAQVSFSIARVVLDTPDAPMRIDYAGIPAPTGSLRPWDVVRWLLFHPWMALALWADRRAAALAARPLGEYVDRLTGGRIQP